MRSAIARTSSSLWLMKTIESPRAVIVAQRAEELLGLLWRQHGGRLVHDEDGGAAVEHLEDLDPLLLAHRELPDHRARVHCQPVLLGEGAGCAPRSCPSSSRKRGSRSPSRMFSVTVSDGTSVKC